MSAGKGVALTIEVILYIVWPFLCVLVSVTAKLWIQPPKLTDISPPLSAVCANISW